MDKKTTRDVKENIKILLTAIWLIETIDLQLPFTYNLNFNSLPQTNASMLIS